MQNWADNNPKHTRIWGKDYLWVFDQGTKHWKLVPVLREAPDGE